MNNPIQQSQLLQTRRHFFGRSCTGIGVAALASLMNESLPAHANPVPDVVSQLSQFAPKAKRVIYLLQSGAPSQVDLFDYKPTLNKLDRTELPDSIRQGQRLTGMTAGQKNFTVVKSPWKFQQHGQSGTWLSELLPHMSNVVDDICVIRSMHTEAINHDPAITFFQSGNQQPGRPSIGAWLSYGLGSETQDLPSFVVLLTKNTFHQAQPLYDRLWGSGFLPSKFQGVKFRSQGDPVLYLNDPTGRSSSDRRAMLDRLEKLNRMHEEAIGDPEISSRIAQYEMAYRMQTSVPELADTSDEPASTFELYGEYAKQPGSHAANCLLARRLAERGVRFIQVFHRGWDHHSNVQKYLPTLAKETDQGSAGLIQDLKQRGMLDETLVIWAGEFGRTVYSQGNPDTFGRDHHPRCFSIWMAGGGIKPGISYGQTDDYCYNIAENPVHVHDFHATLLHCLGINHEQLTYRFQGRDFRLTDVHGKVVSEILS
ncbi:MAG TPA: sulfatase [Planctomycetaceae bacterium]|nr:sulfatase [Planctomycetaceae bacterium]